METQVGSNGQGPRLKVLIGRYEVLDLTRQLCELRAIVEELRSAKATGLHLPPPPASPQIAAPPQDAKPGAFRELVAGWLAALAGLILGGRGVLVNRLLLQHVFARWYSRAHGSASSKSYTPITYGREAAAAFDSLCQELAAEPERADR